MRLMSAQMSDISAVVRVTGWLLPSIWKIVRMALDVDASDWV